MQPESLFSKPFRKLPIRGLIHGLPKFLGHAPPHTHTAGQAVEVTTFPSQAGTQGLHPNHLGPQRGFLARKELSHSTGERDNLSEGES